jgi:glycosyltransferase involved in cell wall biosynthesis
MPAVSVILPVYNGARYLREALTDVFRQTFTDFELIVIDDGSTDATPQILDEFRDSRLVRRTHPHNLGITPSLNEGLALAQSPLVARQDADDRSEPQRLRVQVDFMQSHPDVVLLGSTFVEIDPDGVSRHVVPRETDSNRLRWKLLFINQFCHGSTIYRRDVVTRVGGYSETHRHAEDYGLWERMARVGAVVNLPQPLVRYRVHPGSISVRHNTVQKETDRQISREAITALLGYEPPLAFFLLQRTIVTWDDALRAALMAEGAAAQQAGIRQLADDLLGRFCEQRLPAGITPVGFRRWACAYMGRNLRTQAASLLKTARESVHPAERHVLADTARRALWEGMRLRPGLLAQPRTWKIGRSLLLESTSYPQRMSS